MKQENKNVELECEKTPWYVWLLFMVFMVSLIGIGFKVRELLNTESNIEVKCESGYRVVLSLKNGEESYIECPSEEVQQKQLDWEVWDNTSLLVEEPIYTGELTDEYLLNVQNRKNN